MSVFVTGNNYKHVPNEWDYWALGLGGIGS